MSVVQNRTAERAVLRLVWVGMCAIVAMYGAGAMLWWLKLVVIAGVVDAVGMFVQSGKLFHADTVTQNQKGLSGFLLIMLHNQLLIYFVSWFYVGGVWLVVYLAFAYPIQQLVPEKYEIIRHVTMHILVLSPLLTEIVFIMIHKPIGERRLRADVLLHCTIWVVITGLACMFIASGNAKLEIHYEGGMAVDRIVREWYVVSFVVLQVVYDLGAMFVQGQWEGKAIWPKISTEITWAGAGLGTALALVGAWVISQNMVDHSYDSIRWLVSGLVVGVLGTIGHLLMAKLRWLLRSEKQEQSRYRFGVLLEMLGGQCLAGIGLSLVWL